MNHTIDCDFCGVDQRVAGQRCCQAQVDQLARDAQERRALETQRDDLVKRLRAVGLRSAAATFASVGIHLDLNDAQRVHDAFEKARLL